MNTGELPPESTSEQWLYPLLEGVPFPTITVEVDEVDQNNWPLRITAEEAEAVPAVPFSALSLAEHIVNFPDSAELWIPVGTFSNRLIIQQTASDMGSGGYMVLGGSIFFTESLRVSMPVNQINILPCAAWQINNPMAMNFEGGVPSVVLPGVLQRGSHVFYRPALTLPDLSETVPFIEASMQQPISGEVISAYSGAPDKVVSLFLLNQYFLSPPILGLENENGRQILPSPNSKLITY